MSEDMVEQPTVRAEIGRSSRPPIPMNQFLAALTAELDAGRGIPTAAVDTLIAEVRALRDEAQRLREALIQISRWDCLNPPQVALLADLGWLRGVVDRALTP